MYITAQGPRLRNDLYCGEWDVKLYYTIPEVDSGLSEGPAAHVHTPQDSHWSSQHVDHNVRLSRRRQHCWHVTDTHTHTQTHTHTHTHAHTHTHTDTDTVQINIIQQINWKLSGTTQHSISLTYSSKLLHVLLQSDQMLLNSKIKLKTEIRSTSLQLIGMHYSNIMYCQTNIKIWKTNENRVDCSLLFSSLFDTSATGINRWLKLLLNAQNRPPTGLTGTEHINYCKLVGLTITDSNL